VKRNVGWTLRAKGEKEMGNTVIFDESKLKDGSLYCFSGIVFKDHQTFFQIENLLNNEPLAKIGMQRIFLIRSLHL